MPKVSVIMPSLNVVNYIEHAITSVLNQTLKDIEVICVDAGSDDGTIEILKRYADADSRVQIIMSDKKSYGHQMNLGIKAATGEYIGIVETDDFIKEDMYAELYVVATENNLDFVKSDYLKFWWNEDNAIYVNVAPGETPYNTLLTDEDRELFFRYSSLNWTGIYRRQYLLENDIWHSTTPGASYQDIGFWLLNMSLAKRAMWIPKAFYMYRQDNPTSSMKNRGKICCSRDEYNRVLEILENKKCDIAYKECLMLKHMDYRVTFNRVDDSLKKEYVEVVRDEYAREHEKIASYTLSDRHKSYVEWVHNLLADSEEMCDSIAQHGSDVRDRLDNCRHVFLYGAGLYAKKCFEKLYSAGYWDKVEGIVVSENVNIEKFFEKKVYTFSEMLKNNMISDSDLIILGLGIKNQEEVQALLKANGIRNTMSAKDIESLVFVI